MSAASWIIVAVIAAAVALGGGAPEPLQLLLGLGAAALAALALFSRSLRPLSGTASGVLLAWTGLAVLQTRFAPEGVLATVAILSALALFAVAHTAVPRPERERLLMALGLGGMLVSAAALWTMAPGSAAAFPLDSPDRLGAWLLFPVLLGLAALWLCAPEGRGARWTIAWFAVVTSSAAGLAATRSLVAAFAAVVALAALLALSRVPMRRGFAGGLALAGLLLVSWTPGAESPTGSPLAGAGFGAAALAPRVDLSLARVAALLLSAAVVLRRIRPLPRRRGRGSLAAWGGIAAVICIAALAAIDSSLEVPAIRLTAAVLAGLAWPTASGVGGHDLRRTRAVLLLLSAGIVAALLAGGPWNLTPAG